MLKIYQITRLFRSGKYIEKRILIIRESPLTDSAVNGTILRPPTMSAEGLQKEEALAKEVFSFTLASLSPV